MAQTVKHKIPCVGICHEICIDELFFLLFFLDDRIAENMLEPLPKFRFGS